MTPQSILAIGAHPDDIELGVGGSIAKFTEAGIAVRAVVLTKGEVGNRHSLDRVGETTKALKLLGVQDIHTMDFPDTRLHSRMTDIITYIEEHMKAVTPDRVYTMFVDDQHQDHRAVFEASIVACRAARQIVCYETPSCWSNFQPHMFEPIDEAIFDKKVAALTLHESQRDRPYTQPSAMRVKVQSRGQQVGVDYAEAFIGYKFVLSH